MLPLARLARWLVLIVALVAIGIAVDYWRRCHGPPLLREEALQRAQLRLESFMKSFNVPGEFPRLVDETFESDTNAWLLTYENESCKVIVIVDRCHGDDIGGATACQSK